MTTRAIAAYLSILISALASALVLGQDRPEQPPVFRGAVDLVQVDVYVADANGKPVSGLTAEDFEVFEDGQPRTMAAFAPVEIPVIARERVWADAESDVGTNTRSEGRTYLIYLDGSVPTDMALRARQRLRTFMDRYFGENDVAAIVTGRGLVTDGQDFTNNRRLLTTAIDKFTGGDGQRHGSVSVPNAGDSYLRDFRDRLEMLARMPGHHKMVLWITSQIPFDPYEIMDYHGELLGRQAENVHAAMSAVTRDAIRIFPFDPGGLTTEFGGLEERVNFRGLAELTGGFALYGSNDFEGALERLVRETGTYYVIGFEPMVRARQGRFVRFTVKAKRPGLVVKARAGYLESLNYTRRTRRPEPTRTPAAAALANPASVPGLPIRVNAAAFQGSGKQATVSLTAHVDPSALDFTENNGQFTTMLEFRQIANDARNTVYPEFRHSTAITLSAVDYAHVMAGGLSLVSQLELPRGRHQIRVASASGSKAGSVVYDLEIPDFGGEPLTMSGVALTSTAARGLVTMQANARGGKSSTCTPPRCAGDVRSGSSLTLWDPRAPEAAALPWRTALPSPPTTVREFLAGETLTAYLEVYDNNKRDDSDQPYAIESTVTLRGAGNAVVRSVTAQRVSRDARQRSGGHAFTVDLPLADVEPGAYVLDLEARAARLAVEPVHRRIPIRVAGHQ